MATRKSKLARVLVVLLVLAVVLGVVGWWKLARQVPQQIDATAMDEVFKYGSIGAEEEMGIPFWIWFALPRVFPDLLPRPGGYAALGFAWERGSEVPVGFSRRTIGFERVGINCATCHVTVVRVPGEPVPRIYPGGTGNTIDILAYQRFLFACAGDPRFDADTILGQLAEMTQLSWLDRMLYRYLLIPATRKALLEQQEQFAWTDSRPDWGRGRIDPFNPVKVRLLHVGPGETIGNSDMEPIWNLRPRVDGQMAFHWDGLNTDIQEVFFSSALGDGAVPKSLPTETLKRLEEYLMDLESPRYERLFPVDRELAAAGEPIYRQHCARCHAFGGEQTGKVLPLTAEAWAVEGLDTDAALSTDPHRAEMWTPEAAEAYNAYTDGYPWAFEHFRSTGGYVNVPLDGIWARAPYLHNGSVPYLDELLMPVEERTKLFWAGYDLYDPDRVGFVSEGEDAERYGKRLDTSLPGNSNQGHLWGTDLPDEDKAALLEYLKTL